MKPSWLATAALMLSLLLGQARANAQEPSATAEGDASSQARAHFARGQSAYSQGDYAGAIAAWREAYSLDARPLILYNMSQAEERAGDIAAAAAALERYLETTSGDDPNVPTARNRLSSLNARLAATSILVEGAPSGAEILVDDRSWGLSPRPDAIGLAPGEHHVLVRHADYNDFELTLNIPAGQRITVRAAMSPRAHGEGTAAAASSSSVPVILMASGGGLVVGAAVLGGVALSRANSADFSSGPDADRAHKLALSADIIGGVGLAAAVGGLVWFLVARPESGSSDDASAAQFRAAPLLGRGLVGLDTAVVF